MQIIRVTDPETKEELKIEVSPVQLEDQQGWTVHFEDGKDLILATDQHGIWKQVDGNDIGSALIPVIGIAIERQMSSEGF